MDIEKDRGKQTIVWLGRLSFFSALCPCNYEEFEMLQTIRKLHKNVFVVVERPLEHACLRY